MPFHLFLILHQILKGIIDKTVVNIALNLENDMKVGTQFINRSGI